MTDERPMPTNSDVSAESVEALIEKLRGWPAGFGHDALSALVVAGLMKAAADRLAAITPDHAEWRRCIAIIEEVRDSFLSPEYAMGDPMDLIRERFACNRAIDAIRGRFSQPPEEA